MYYYYLFLFGIFITFIVIFIILYNIIKIIYQISYFCCFIIIIFIDTVIWLWLRVF